MWRILMPVLVVAGVAAASAQGPGVPTLMREKLLHSQRILEAVVTSDWASLETHARELERLTTDQRWMVFRYPEYARQSADFVRELQGLRQAAAKRDLEGTPKAFVSMTMQCVGCHRYIARMRIAK
jgi:hypothetical protein